MTKLKEKTLNIGILAFHGDVYEHELAMEVAAKKLGLEIQTLFVRTKADLSNLDGLIIPGGESPTLQKLLEREGMWQEIKKIRNIFGTCAGAIMLAKKINKGIKGQKTLELMDIEVSRNAYGRQNDSFEKVISTPFGKINAVFIRAPKIKAIGRNVKVLVEDDGVILACEQREGKQYFLATTFHPELSTTKFHEHFLKQILLNTSTK